MLVAVDDVVEVMVADVSVTVTDEEVEVVVGTWHSFE